MKKKLLKLLALLAVLFVVLIVVVLVWIDSIARKGIEVGATATLGVNTTLKDINIGIFSGKVSMHALEVANPSGFKGSHFMKLGDGRVAVTLGSLMGDTVEVGELALSDIEVSMEKKDGKANYQAILDNLKKGETAGAGGGTSGGASGGKKFVIRELLIRNVVVNADVLPVGGPLKLTVPEIRLKNVGTGAGGSVDMKELVNVIMKAVFASIFDAGKNILPGDVLGEMGKGLDGLKSLGSMGVGVVGEMGKNLGEGVTKAVGENVGKAADEAGKNLEKGVGDIGKGIGDLFGGEKK